MTLLDLTKELFTYLVRFREQAAGERPPTLEKVEADLEAVFARMQDQAEDNPLLAKGFEQVRYSLAALVDEVVLTSLWPHQAQWGQRGWERRLFGSQDGPRRFFDFLDSLENLPKDVLAVHYLCLALGFCGCYHPSDPELQQIKSRVLTRLPGLESGNGPMPAQAISLTPLPASNPAPAPETPAARASAGATAQAPEACPRPRDLRYLLAGGLAVLAFLFTLGLGAMIFYDGQTDQPEETALEELLKPLLPPRTADSPAASTPAPAAKAMAQVDGAPAATPAPRQTRAPATAHPTAPTTAPTTTRTTATSQTTASSATTITQAPDRPASPSPPAAPSASETTAPPAGTAPTTYLLHAGLFVGPIQSGRLAEQLGQAGFAAWVREDPRPDGSVRYRVYVGPFADPQRAEAARQAIVAQFKFSPYLVENPTP